MPVIRTINPIDFPAGETLLPDANGLSIANNANSKFRVTTTLNQATLDDPATHFWLELWVLVNSIWTFNAGIEFRGGPNQGKGGTITQPPGMQIDMAEVRQRTIRGRLVTDTAITMGLVIERLR